LQKQLARRAQAQTRPNVVVLAEGKLYNVVRVDDVEDDNGTIVLVAEPLIGAEPTADYG
jgi:hypothetical protein